MSAYDDAPDFNDDELEAMERELEVENQKKGINVPEYDIPDYLEEPEGPAAVGGSSSHDAATKKRQSDGYCPGNHQSGDSGGTKKARTDVPLASYFQPVPSTSEPPAPAPYASSSSYSGASSYNPPGANEPPLPTCQCGVVCMRRVTTKVCPPALKQACPNEHKHQPPRVAIPRRAPTKGVRLFPAQTVRRAPTGTSSSGPTRSRRQVADTTPRVPTRRTAAAAAAAVAVVGLAVVAALVRLWAVRRRALLGPHASAASRVCSARPRRLGRTRDASSGCARETATRSAGSSSGAMRGPRRGRLGRWRPRRRTRGLATGLKGVTAAAVVAASAVVAAVAPKVARALNVAKKGTGK